MKKKLNFETYIYKRLKYFGLYIILFTSAFAYSQSADFIKINDTTLVYSGVNYKVPVYSNFDLSNAGSVKITFKFNNLLLDIKGIYSGTDYGFLENATSFTLNTANFTESYLEVTCNKFNPNNNGILFNIQLETLAGPDSITWLTPFEVTINGVLSNNIELDSGKISLGLPIYPIINEGISVVYPNPFGLKGTVTFSIRDDTFIKFYIYSSNGRLIGTIPGENAFISKIFDKANKEITDVGNYTFTRGYYKMTFDVIPWKFASGLYFLVLETTRGTYDAKLLHLK